jgi:hypothetical protein
MMWAMFMWLLYRFLVVVVVVAVAAAVHGRHPKGARRRRWFTATISVIVTGSPGT